ncbi:hypothetical protein UFOVP783_7 [uncultured Caudovirales phage]|uniref:Uncharacterized protein n=1 Tax=uncultured Caudovirales phage TaxID=2100421 RepID=A0A6J5NRE1_9CAUD|nr:hypothetical protein UFOVP783_7 [uncultured Caudovirales phage]
MNKLPHNRMLDYMFPKPTHTYPGGSVEHGSNGETLQVYAAIHLKVPQSGIPALDAMIRESRRMDAILGTLTGDRADGTMDNTPERYTEIAVKQANALLAALEKEEAGGAE